MIKYKGASRNIREHAGTILIILIIILLSLGVGYYFFNSSGGGEEQGAEVDFELDTLFLKVSLSVNSTTINHIKIADGIGDFSIKVNEIPGLVDFRYPEEVVDGEEGEEGEEGEKREHEIEIIFNSNGVEPGVYLGELEISTKDIIKIIPIILEVQTDIVVFDSNLNLYPAGKNILPGDTFNANVRIFDLVNFERSSIEVVYSVEDFSGNTVLSETENLIIEDKLDYTKSLTLPESTELGNYVLTVVVSYTDSVGDQSVGTSAVLFKVAEEKEDEGALSEKAILYVIIMFGFFFLIFLGLFVYTLFFRDKMLKELQRQYKGELRRQMQLIRCRSGQDYNLLKGPEEKREYRKEVEEIKKLRKVKLSEVKEKKIIEFKEIKKKYTGSNLKKQLQAWKKRGYNTQVLERKYKMPSVKSIKAKVSDWKRKGYDTSLLEKKRKK